VLLLLLPVWVGLDLTGLGFENGWGISMGEDSAGVVWCAVENEACKVGPEWVTGVQRVGLHRQHTGMHTEIMSTHQGDKHGGLLGMARRSCVVC
jgi:hypothetical protein